MTTAATAVVASSNKTEKSKKFQSLNINNLYQGSTNKPLQRSVPQKHGLQSLGKVPTARRAPANLPSLKAENCSNDGGAILPPNGGTSGGTSGGTGQSAVAMGNSAVSASAGTVGWTGGKDELNYGIAKTLQQQFDGGVGGGGIVDKKRNALEGSLSAVAASSQEKSSWGGGVKPTTTDSRSQSFLNQRSPLFGQEFPSLGDGGSTSTGEDAGNNIGMTRAVQPVTPASGFSSVAAAAPASGGLTGGLPDAKYGPGPSLRPQTSGNWLHGGIAKIENGVAPPASAVGISSSGDGHSSAADGGGGLGGAVGMSGSSRLVDSFLHKLPPSSTLPAPVLPQFDVSLKGPQAAPSPLQSFTKKLPSTRSGGVGFPVASGGPKRSRACIATQGVGNSGHASQYLKERDREMQTFKEHSIIDDEKLKRMDIIEVTEDDWTRNDDNFDYNKKLKSDDDDESSPGTWDEYRTSKKSLHIGTRIVNLDRGGTSSSRGPGVASSSCYSKERIGDPFSHGLPGSDDGKIGRGQNNESQLQTRIRGRQGGQTEQRDVIDDEEERRVRKNEEILKNIERARKRREEEENKYKLSHEFSNDEAVEDNSYSRFKQSVTTNSRHEYDARDHRRSPARGNFDVSYNGKEEIDKISNSASSVDFRDQRLKYSHSPPTRVSKRASASPPELSVVDKITSAPHDAPTQASPSNISTTTPSPPQQRFKRLGGELLQSNNEQLQHEQRHRSRNSGDHDEHANISNAWGRTGSSSKQRELSTLLVTSDLGQDNTCPPTAPGLSQKVLFHGSEGSRNELNHEGSLLDDAESSTESYSSFEKVTDLRDSNGQQRKRLRRQRPGESAKLLQDHNKQCASEDHSPIQAEKELKQMRARGESAARKTRTPTLVSNHSLELNTPQGLLGYSDSKRSEAISTLAKDIDEGRTLDCDQRSDGFKQEANKLPSNHQKSGRVGSNELQSEGGDASIFVDSNEDLNVDTSLTKVRDIALNLNGSGGTSACGSGWFVPRGQPSRRGRGASQAVLGGRSTSVSSKGQARSMPMEEIDNFIEIGDCNEDTFADIAEDNEEEISSGLRRNDTSDIVGGRRSGGREKSRRNKQERREGCDDYVGDDDDSIHKRPIRSNGGKLESSRRSGGKGPEDGSRLMNRNSLSQQQQPLLQHHQPLHSGSSGNMFERRQNKLPPRLAKQREQNRAMQKGQQHIQLQQQHPPCQDKSQDTNTDITGGADSGWGGGDSLAFVSDNSYGTSGWTKYDPNVQASNNNPSADNLANMFEQLGKGQSISCTPGGQGNTAGVGTTYVANKLLAAAAASKDGSQTGIIGHSGSGKDHESPGDHHVQTIIFENTNFKGGPPGTRVTACGEVGVGPAVGTNEKTVTTAAVTATAQQLQFVSKCSDPGFKTDTVAAGGGIQSGPGIQIQGLGFPPKSGRKHGDGTPDLKIDFTSFNSEMSMPMGTTSVTAANMAATSTSVGPSGISDQHVPSKSSHTAEELNMKIASVKKVWDTYSIEDGSGGPVFAGGSRFHNEGGAGSAAECRSKAGEQFSKTDVTPGVPNKSRLAAEGVGGMTAYPQHPTLPQQPLSHMQTHQSGNSADFDHRNSQRSMAAIAAAAAAAVSGNSGNNTVSVHQGVQQSGVSGNSAASMAFSRLGLSALPSPPSILGNQAVAAAVAAAAQQPQSIYQTFQLDGRSAAAAAAVTNQLYPAYAAAAGMSGLAATANDIFSAAAAGGNQFRLTPQQFQQQSHQQPLVSSQPSMMTSGLKQQHSQIGPIGTKGNQGGGHFQPQQQHQPPPHSGLGSGGTPSGGGSGVGGGGGSSQGGLGGLPVSASSPLLIQYDAAAAAAAAGNYLPSALQRSAAAAALHSHHSGLQNQQPQGGQTAFYQALSTQQHAAAAIQAATAAVAANQGRQQHQQQQNAAAAAAAVAAFASTGGSGGGSGAGLHGYHANVGLQHHHQHHVGTSGSAVGNLRTSQTIVGNGGGGSSGNSLSGYMKSRPSGASVANTVTTTRDGRTILGVNQVASISSEVTTTDDVTNATISTPQQTPVSSSPPPSKMHATSTDEAPVVSSSASKTGGEAISPSSTIVKNEATCTITTPIAKSAGRNSAVEAPSGDSTYSPTPIQRPQGTPTSVMESANGPDCSTQQSDEVAKVDKIEED